MPGKTLPDFSGADQNENKPLGRRRSRNPKHLVEGVRNQGDQFCPIWLFGGILKSPTTASANEAAPDLNFCAWVHLVGQRAVG